MNFEEITKRLKPYRASDLISAAGALHLVPSNCNFGIRIEAFSYAATSLKEDSEAKIISEEALKEILNTSKDLASLAHLDDPFENLLTEEIHFFGGGYVVFPGIVEDSVFITKHLCKALFLSDAFTDAKAFLRRIRKMTEAILILSNAIANKASYSRYIKPQRADGGQIIIPASNIFELLKKAVTFEKHELIDILNKRNLQLDNLEPFVCEIGSFKPEEYDPQNMPLFKKPIVKVDSKYIVVLPGLLLAALRHEILVFAKRYDYLEKSATAFREACWHTTTTSLSFTKNPETQASNILESSASGKVKQGVFRLDEDKIIYLQLWTDPFEEYAEDKIFGHYDSKKDMNELLTLEESAIRKITEKYRGINEIVTLTVFQGIGRMHIIGLNSVSTNYEPLKVLFSVAGLETVCWLEGGKNLTWYQFAYASENVRKNARVISTNPLDEFGFYHERDNSYYASDEVKPHLISLLPGYAGALRAEVLKKRDFHTVQSFNTDYTVEVTSLHDDNRVPICSPIRELGGRIAFVLESYDVPIWIVAPELSDDHSGLKTYYFEFADMIAYWLWESTGELKDYVNEFSEKGQTILINLELTDPETWLSSRRYEIEREIEFKDACIATLTSNRSILFQLTPKFPYFFHGHNNERERVFVYELIKSLRDLLIAAGCSKSMNMSDEIVGAIIERVAPIGLKKKFMVLDSSVNPLLDERDIPNKRFVQGFNEQKLLDDLGDYLTKECGYTTREINREERINFLNKNVVGYLFQKLEAIISTLDHSELIGFLIAHDEAIIYEREFTKLTIPTRIACFVSHQELLDELIKNTPKIDQSAGAIRFLIEYVAARPPHGRRPISYSMFDELMALSAAIISWGSISDLIKYEVADVRFAILESGRLGTSFEGFDRKRDLFTKDVLSDAIHKARDRFGRFWRKLPDGKTPQEINEAFQDEWGYLWDDLADVVRVTHTLGMQKAQAAIGFEENVLIEHIEKNTTLSDQKIRKILADLIIKPRETFLSAEGTNKTDVYPWRYNRNMSYLRRPFIMVEGNKKRFVVWGNRHLQYAMNHLLGLMSAGRLKAKSKKMRELMGISRNRQGLAFNEIVYEHFKARDGLKVDKRRKIPRSFSDEAGQEQTIGDIDVLIMDSSNKRIIALECKDISAARNPHELKQELAEIFSGEKSIISKQQKIIQWVTENKKLVLNHYSIPSDDEWLVLGAVVLDEIMLATYLRDKNLPILSYVQIKQMTVEDIIKSIT